MEKNIQFAAYDDTDISFYSKERQISDKIESMMATEAGTNEEQSSAISELQNQMEAQSSVDGKQDEKLSSLEEVNATQDSSITELENTLSTIQTQVGEQDEKLSSFEEKVSNIITEERVAEMINEAAYDDTDLKAVVNGKQDVGDYALKSDIPSLDGYATEEWVEEQNYLTEHISLDEINAAIAELKSLQSQLETKTELLMRSSSSIKVVAKVEDMQALSASEKKETNLVISSQDVIESMTSKEPLKSLTIVDGATDKSINVAAKNLTINGLLINGEKDGGNGKINYSANTVEVSNVVINSSNQNYNVFEGTQINNEYRLDSLMASDITVDDVNLKHNVFNVYAPNDGCEIVIKDSYFNINVHRTNVLRISNYFGAENVSIVFDNVKWTYENYDYSDLESLKDCAGLMLYQAVTPDVADTENDFSHMKTWSIKFKNCYYGDEKLTEWNEGKINQSLYAWSTQNQLVLNPKDVFGEIIYE